MTFGVEQMTQGKQTRSGSLFLMAPIEDSFSFSYRTLPLADRPSDGQGYYKQ